VSTLVCDAPELVRWRPDFSNSEQDDPDWTKLVCGDVELCNTLEAANWTDEWAVQVEVCAECGYVHCSSGGWVHVSRLGRHLLWTPAEVDPEDEYAVSEYRPPDYLRRHCAVAIPVDAWEHWRGSIAELPRPASFRPARRRHLRRAWARPERFDLLAAEREATNDAAAHLRAVAEWLELGDAPVDAELVPAEAVGARLETLYIDVPDTFDRPQLREWRPYAVADGRLAPAFSGGWTIEPLPIPLPA
jgi:hypothetical protein